MPDGLGDLLMVAVVILAGLGLVGGWWAVRPRRPAPPPLPPRPDTSDLDGAASRADQVAEDRAQALDEIRAGTSTETRADVGNRARNRWRR